MTKKSSDIEPKKSMRTYKPRRRRRTRQEIEDDEHLDELEREMRGGEAEQEVDEFESQQNLAESPATLFKENVDRDEEEPEEKKPEKKKPAPENTNLTARGNKNKHYVKPVEFEALIELYYKKGVLTNDLCDCVYKIANRLSYRPNFINYSYREEMVGDAIERMIFALSNRIYKYNPNKIGKNGKKGNAFLYFTKIAENAFINRIKIEARNHDAIARYQEEVYNNLLQKGIDIGKSGNIIVEI